MADNYDRYENEHGGGFMMGLLTGTVLGAGLGMLLAPKGGAELRGQLGEQARHLANTASEQYRRASEAASGWAERGREAMGQSREGVGRGSEQGRGYAGATTGSSYTGGTSGSSFGAGGGTTGTTGTTGTSGTSGGGSDFGRS
jgi:gas vesicle protein